MCHRLLLSWWNSAEKLISFVHEITRSIMNVNLSLQSNNNTGNYKIDESITFMNIWGSPYEFTALCKSLGLHVGRCVCVYTHIYKNLKRVKMELSYNE